MVSRLSSLDFFGGAYARRVEQLALAKKEGRKVLGTFCLYVPDEVIFAAGADRVILCGGKSDPIPLAEVKATLTIGSESQPSPAAEMLATAAKSMPKDGQALAVAARWEGPAAEKKRALLLSWKPDAKPDSADFLPYAGKDYEVAPDAAFSAAPDGGARLQLTLSRSGEIWPDKVGGVLLQRMRGEKVAQAFEVFRPPPAILWTA